MNNKFEFKYAAPTQKEREEIKNIQNQYKQKKQSETKLEQLRKLHSKVQNIPAVVALSLGFVGILIFGLGLAMVLEWNLLVWGIVVSAVGCVPMGLAYFAYNNIYTKLKNKYSSTILDLSSELLNEEPSPEQ